MQMTSTTTMRSTQVPSPAPKCDCPTPCPSCGGLNCLCRPRFFAGQVLTEDDLNRLENYVIEKNKLHNRYFYGAGVVCGLEVVCDICNTANVTVKTGYALSPCGEDIVVCKDASVNVCDLINRCKPVQNNCDPYGFQQPGNCTQGVQKWVLSICYNETPSRGVQPLTSGASSCGCGGGCGCSGKTGASSKPAKTSSSAQGAYNALCEPTLICEGFSFTATKYVDPNARKTADLKNGVWGMLAAKADQFGPLLTRLLACHTQAGAIRPAAPHPGTAGTAPAVAYSDYLTALRDFAAEHAPHRCDLARKLACLDQPGATAAGANGQTDTTMVGAIAGTPAAAAAYVDQFRALDAILDELQRDCLCSALLPPCPDPQPGDCVPLAVVTIDADKCQVLEICNWSAREFALTPQAFAYWTSFINWGALKDVVAGICCDTARAPLVNRTFAMFDDVMTANTQPLDNVTMAQYVAAGGTAENYDAMIKRATVAGTNPFGSTYQAALNFVGRAALPDGTARILATGSNADSVAELQLTVTQLQAAVADLNLRMASR
ncbi:MAG TPA: hypothetical protein VII56_19215 [Rhizomicrobium sp.]